MNSWWQNSIWMKTSFRIQEREAFMWLRKRGSLCDASKDCLKKRGKTTFYGTGWAMVRKSFLPEARISLEDAQTCTKLWPDPALTSPTRMGSKRGHPARAWGSVGVNGEYRAMTEESVLPSITSTDVASKNCPCCRRSRCWWSVVQTLSNPRSAWKRQ